LFHNFWTRNEFDMNFWTWNRFESFLKIEKELNLPPAPWAESDLNGHAHNGTDLLGSGQQWPNWPTSTVHGGPLAQAISGRCGMACAAQRMAA
jgi:hypothetical protein